MVLVGDALAARACARVCVSECQAPGGKAGKGEAMCWEVTGVHVCGTARLHLVVHIDMELAVELTRSNHFKCD